MSLEQRKKLAVHQQMVEFRQLLQDFLTMAVVALISYFSFLVICV